MAWATSTARPTRFWDATSRSRSWPTGMPRTARCASASRGRLSRRRVSRASPTWSRSSTSASTPAAPTSSWSTSAAVRSTTVLRKDGPPPPERTFTWLEQAGRALDVAHREGVVHRDVKPANLMLDREGNVHVADFGIASATGLDSLTMTGTVLGTAGYLSPEQAQGERATPASDRYATRRRGVRAADGVAAVRRGQSDCRGGGTRECAGAVGLGRARVCRASSTRSSSGRSRRIPRSATRRAPISSRHCARAFADAAGSDERARLRSLPLPTTLPRPPPSPASARRSAWPLLAALLAARRCSPARCSRTS